MLSSEYEYLLRLMQGLGVDLKHYTVDNEVNEDNPEAEVLAICANTAGFKVNGNFSVIQIGMTQLVFAFYEQAANAPTVVFNGPWFMFSRDWSNCRYTPRDFTLHSNSPGSQIHFDSAIQTVKQILEENEAFKIKHGQSKPRMVRRDEHDNEYFMLNQALKCLGIQHEQVHQLPKNPWQDRLFDLGIGITSLCALAIKIGQTSLVLGLGKVFWSKTNIDDGGGPTAPFLFLFSDMESRCRPRVTYRLDGGYGEERGPDAIKAANPEYDWDNLTCEA